MRKQPERTERTRQALMDSFWNLYLVKRIERITVQEVVDQAGVYRSTFYEYFRDVYDVLETIENDLLRRFEAVRTSARCMGEMEAVVEHVLSFYEENGARIAHLLCPNGDPAFTARALQIIKANFMQSMHLSAQDIQQDLLFDLLASSVVTLLNYWYAHQQETTVREVFRAGLPLLKQGFPPYITDLKAQFLTNQENNARSE